MKRVSRNVKGAEEAGPAGLAFLTTDMAQNKEPGHLPAWVKRVGPDGVEISWEGDGDGREVRVYMGTGPDRIDRTEPIALVTGANRVRVSGLDPRARYYFDVVHDGAPGVKVAERRVPMEGPVNFRDLGGYVSGGGKQVRWGEVFRSDSLARMTDRDRDLLRAIGVRTVCDFRTAGERQKAPYRLWEGARYFHLPVLHGEYDPAGALDRILRGDVDWMSTEAITQGYIRNIERFPDVWRRVFTLMASSGNRPLVGHCTGGKDRAGVFAALTLLTLGVTEETVLSDHGLSNAYIAGLLEGLFEKLASKGVDIEKVRPYFTAPPECMEAFLEHLRRRYGSAEAYLRQKAKVDEKTLAALREQLLD